MPVDSAPHPWTGKMIVVPVDAAPHPWTGKMIVRTAMTAMTKRLVRNKITMNIVILVKHHAVVPVILNVRFLCFLYLIFKLCSPVTENTADE